MFVVVDDDDADVDVEQKDRAADASQGDNVVKNGSMSKWPCKKRDHDTITIDSPVSSSVVNENSRRVSDSFPERISVEGCETDGVNEVYQFDGLNRFGNPVYVKKATGGQEKEYY